MKDKIVCIFGSGYAGLPLANAFVIENKSVVLKIPHELLTQSNGKKNI